MQLHLQEYFSTCTSSGGGTVGWKCAVAVQRPSLGAVAVARVVFGDSGAVAGNECRRKPVDWNSHRRAQTRANGDSRWDSLGGDIMLESLGTCPSHGDLLDTWSLCREIRTPSEL